MRILAFVTVALLAGLTHAAAAGSGTAGTAPGILSPTLTSGVGLPAPPRTFSPILKIQGRACTACRATCVQDWKTDCYDSESYCRRQFTRCMRICWEDYCR